MKLTQWQAKSTTEVPRAQIEFVRGGGAARLDALDVVNVPFEMVDRVRVPVSWKHKQNYEGFYWAATIGAHVWFESLYERAALMRIDRDDDVVGIAAQPMWIYWSRLGGKHAPDFFVRYRDGGGVLIDVKPEPNIGEDDATTFTLTSALCAQLGWGYAVISDISAQEHRNLRFLSGYRYPRWRTGPVDVRLHEHAGDRHSLTGWAELLDSVCEQPLGAVYSALWWGGLDFDVRTPLSLAARATAV